jgi:uncharacterized protein YbbC (DUF1343 family)/CubicO group peptidase (beta-lactamase class C family)
VWGGAGGAKPPGEETSNAQPKMQTLTLTLTLLLASAVTAAQTSPPTLTPAPDFDAGRLSRIDELVTQAIGERKLPGAVVIVGRGDRIVYRKAVGSRALVPAAEPMTADTIFDVASLTKVVATTTSAMMLIEEGRLRLNDPVASFVPDFGRYGKDRITIRHLMTHVSGLRPDLDLSAEFDGYEEAIRRATEEIPTAPPGERFIYSDINYFLLGDIVARVSGMPLERFARTRIFEPLGMRDTMFRPPASLAPRIAPTEPCSPLGWPCNTPGATMLRGVVHDPTARRMGGVAGHAGLFSTADDLSIFCRMLLNGGVWEGKRLMSAMTIEKMTSPATPPGMRNVRALGWDLDSSLSSNRGELFPLGSYGHTGFTGTSIWIDPHTRVFVIFLSNRVHPDGKGDVTPLRAKVATTAAAALTDSLPASSARELRWTGTDHSVPVAPPRPAQPVLTGIDVLRGDGFAPLRGKRVGLLTNPVGRARDGQSTIDLLHGAPGVTLAALFSPEHGIRGVLDDKVASSTDAKTGLTIHSLYGDTLRPTADMLRGLDTVVVDLQDIGARFYTYMSTVGYLLEEAARARIAVMVLDRPNPIGGVEIEGPVPDEDALGFTAYVPMPIRHALTLGELARLFNDEHRLGAELTVVPMKNWSRDQWYDETGVPWVNPSPNMRTLNAATLYPGIGAFESTNISVGRGTDTPFEHLGAPWIDGVRLAEALNAREIAGVTFYPVEFTPAAGAKFGGLLCRGVFMVVTNRAALRPVRLGIEVASALVRLHGETFEIDKAARLFGSRARLARIKSGDDPALVATSWGGDEAKWRLTIGKYLLYR